MTLNFIERMKYYNELKEDFDKQVLENSRKQERIVNLKREKRELEEENKDLKKQIESLKEVLNARSTNTKRK